MCMLRTHTKYLLKLAFVFFACRLVLYLLIHDAFPFHFRSHKLLPLLRKRVFVHYWVLYNSVGFKYYMNDSKYNKIKKSCFNLIKITNFKSIFIALLRLSNYSFSKKLRHLWNKILEKLRNLWNKILENLPIYGIKKFNVVNFLFHRWRYLIFFTILLLQK